MKKQQPNDIFNPLYVIFEQQLYTFDDPDMDRQKFVSSVIKEYFKFLQQKQITVPLALQPYMVDELEAQVTTMLVKKIYGCYSIKEYQKKTKSSTRKKARERYQRLKA